MSKVIWIDEVGDRWENLEDWRELMLCPRYCCSRCPLSSMNNGTGLNCQIFVEKHPERVLELMQGRLCRVEVKERKRGEIPLLCEMLDVEPFQEFWLEDERVWAVDEEGNRWERVDGEWKLSDDEKSLLELLRSKEKIHQGEIAVELKRALEGEEKRGVERLLAGLFPNLREWHWSEDYLVVRVEDPEGNLAWVKMDPELIKRVEK